MANQFDLIVIGAGPGGYAAAFYAADSGLKVALIEKYSALGGVCLNVGCIPSKALLHLMGVKDEAEEMANFGVNFGKPKIDLEKIREFKNSVIGKMTGGLNQLAKMRKVKVYQGVASFENANAIIVSNLDEQVKLSFNHIIIASGSSPVVPPVFDLQSKKVMTSTGALKLENIPKDFLIVGGGVIGLEMAFIYASLGSKVTIIEASDNIATGADRDLVKIFKKKIIKKVKAIYVKTKVEAMSIVNEKNNKEEKVKVVYRDQQGKKIVELFDKVLLAIGRKPNSANLHLDKAGVSIDDRGFIQVDRQMRTNVDNIFAIGDVVGNPMLAHKSAREGHIAVDVILGKKEIWDHAGIPSVIYTDPELAWVGLTEIEAKKQKIDYKVGNFPWAANGRAVAMNKNDGLTKILFDPKTEKILGVGMVGYNAGELIAEATLALEMGALVDDITGTIHAHPTVSETFMEAAEDLHGIATHIYNPKKK